MLIQKVAAGSRKSKVKAVILTADKFEDLEVIYPYFRLLEAGVTVHIAAPTKDIISGEHGYKLTPDIKIDEVKADRYDLLLIPGGFPDGAPATVRRQPNALKVTQTFFAKRKPVASICHGPWTLVSAGVVKGRKLTSYWYDGVPEEVKGAGGNYQDRAVVVDGKLVTSRWPPDLPAFMDEVMKMVGKIRK